ncbi:MAG TPA: ABC transporter ATP-binding protein [Chitinophagaceae bacterium]|nr:ABC transporter ATP-binding protein [Chitinophagaceae bacterium]
MQPLLSIQNVSKQYGEKTVLNHVNLDIYPGQVIGYIGPNGAGKSTTVKILTGVIQDYTGTVLVNGRDIKEDILALKQMIGYVPELADLYDLLTPNEYLHFVGALYNMPDSLVTERATKILQSFGLLDNIDQRMDSFSKGMRQKVLLTAGILHNPSIVILDEPMSGLDANAVIVVKELIQVLKQEGKTIFYCSHMMDVVEKVSDKIVLIDKGTIIANDTIEALREGSSNSLETIFAQMTTSENLNETAGNIAQAMRSNN